MLSLSLLDVKRNWLGNIRNDLLNAWATVVYNSSPSVASLIEGVPVFVTDTDPSVSQVNGVCNTNLKRLEDPKMYDRQEWIERLSMCHWNFNELKSGEAWSFFSFFHSVILLFNRLNILFSFSTAVFGLFKPSTV